MVHRLGIVFFAYPVPAIALRAIWISHVWLGRVRMDPLVHALRATSLPVLVSNWRAKQCPSRWLGLVEPVMAPLAKYRHESSSDWRTLPRCHCPDSRGRARSDQSPCRWSQLVSLRGFIRLLVSLGLLLPDAFELLRPVGLIHKIHRSPCCGLAHRFDLKLTALADRALAPVGAFLAIWNLHIWPTTHKNRLGAFYAPDR